MNQCSSLHQVNSVNYQDYYAVMAYTRCSPNGPLMVEQHYIILIQVVNNEHLLLHCRGASTSFSAHVIRMTDNSGKASVRKCLLLVVGR